MDFIKGLEGSQPVDPSEVLVNSLGACEVVGGSGRSADGVGQVASQVSPMLLQVDSVVVGSACGQLVGRGDITQGMSPQVTPGDPPPGMGPSEILLPPRVLTTSQEVNLIGALREGRSFAQVAGSSVPLDHIYSRFGARNFRAPPGQQQQGEGIWSQGVGGPERKRRNVVQMKYMGEGQCPTHGEVIDLVLTLGVRIADLFAVYTRVARGNMILALCR